jgi:hypothetical protein
MRNGAAQTNATLAAYAAELRDLQLKVESLTGVVTRIDATLATVDAEGRTSIEAMRNQLRAAVDDLGDRVGALTERLDARP